MAKQYRRRQAASSGGGLLRSLMFVCVSFFSGYMVASYMDIGRLGNWLSSLAPQTSQLVPTPQLATHTQKPKLEFYTLLTANHASVAVPPRPVPTPAHNTPAVVEKSATIAHTTVAMQQHVAPVTTGQARPVREQIKPAAPKSMPAKVAYTIQVAALRTQQDAERMKASLLLRGFQVNVSTIASNGITWYRVMVGPFASRAQAEETQSVLVRRERMNGMIKAFDRTA